MQYRALGKTGLRVSEIGFGAWGIGGEWGGRDDQQAIAAIHRALDLGVNFIDTAHVYGQGHSETLIGQAIKDRSDKPLIATKIPPKTYRWPVLPTDRAAETFPADWVVQCTEESLRRLGVERIDIQQFHAWTPAFETQTEWRDGIEKLKKQGKIRAFGVSANDWDPYGTVGAVERGLIETVQVIYNIFEQRPAEGLLPAALKQGVGIIVRVPFEEGLLTGTLSPEYQFAEGDWRAKWLPVERRREVQTRVKKLEKFLAPDRPTLASLALKFCLSHPAISTVIPGMRRPSHVEQNAGASDGLPLPESTVDELRRHAFIHGWAYPWAQK